ncbi:hypothetical protein BDZ97DRAFT_1008092 [Flammula alnicola]|nr:hypothetical protein BDZ97DRAFT_1008092 [Flammula alnicola]
MNPRNPFEKKTVFKQQSEKLPFSKNRPHACEYCHVVRRPGQTPFSVCASCQSARY